MGSRGAYILEALEVRKLLAAQLVADIDASAGSSNPQELVATSSLLYFSAADASEYRQLYATDGASTFRIKDLSTSLEFDGPERLTVVGDTVYFWDRSSFSADLWKTDGTAGGTVKLSTFSTSTSAAYNEAPPLVVLGSSVYFSISTTTYGKEVWKSDGTVAGTVLVKDIRAGATSSQASYLTAFKNAVWFLCPSTASGYLDLYKTTGTSTGTTLVKQVRMSQAISESWMLAAPDRLFFAAADSFNGVGLWSSDGTSANTARIDTLSNPAPKPLGVLGSRLIYTAYAVGSNREPWSSDGTAAGTGLLVDMWPNSYSGFLGVVGAAGGLFYLSGKDSTGTYLWITDGTPTGTAKVKAITADLSTASTQVGGDFAGRLFFAAQDSAGWGSELWVSDGSSAGTSMLKDIYGGAKGSSPAWATPFNGRVYFKATDAQFGGELWISDGTAGGTMLFRNMHAGTMGSSPQSVQVLGSNAFFGAYTNTIAGTVLYRSDLTTAGTKSVVNPDLSMGRYGNTAFTAMGGNRLFFCGDDWDHGDEPWITDGTASGTFRLVDIYPGYASSSYPFALGVIGGDLYFSATTDGSNTTLWKTDGTSAGTVMIATLSAEITSYQTPLVYGNKIFFTADDGTNGEEPWVTDGTAAGTFMLKNITGDWTHSYPELFTVYHEMVYFLANDSELWKTDGTSSGTVLAADLWPAFSTTITGSMVVFNDKLVFDGSASLKGRELICSDGTLAGTSVFADVNPGGASSSPSKLTVVGNRLFFTANDGSHGVELWRSDGVSTVMVQDLSAGSGNSYPSHLTAIGNTLYFAASTPATGEEPWRIGASDPLPTLIADVNPGRDSSSSEQFVLVNGQVAFRANDGFSGYELWRETTDNTAPTVTGSKFEWAPIPKLSFSFSENVARSFEAGDVSVRNLTTGQLVAWPTATFAFDPSSNTVTFFPAGYAVSNLPDGNYRVTLGAGSVTDASGNGLAGDFTMDFFVLKGDANRDRAVNFFDLTALSANYGLSGKVWADGDFNGDGMVNFFDLTTLAARYGTELPAPADVPQAASVVGETAAEAAVVAVDATWAPVTSVTVSDVKSAAATTAVAEAVLPPASVAQGRSNKARRSKPIFAVTPPIVRPPSRKPHTMLGRSGRSRWNCRWPGMSSQG